jgi:dipeptidase D
VRSAVDTEKLDLASAVRCALEPLDGTVECTGDYPGWIPRPEAAIVKLMSGLYREMFGSDAAVLACHAGLECGIVGARYPDLQMISFGPNIRGAHSPDEKVQISSVQKFWRFLTKALTRMPPA